MGTLRGMGAVSVYVVVLVLAGLRPLAGHERKLHLSEEKKVSEGDGFRLELMYRDHKDSPLYEDNLTPAQRIGNAAKRSQIRANFIRSILGLETKQQFSTKDAFQSPLSAAPGSYTMSISLGTPAQKKIAIADTGSDLTWVQCSPCDYCYSQPDSIFSPSSSSSYHTISCSNALCSDLDSYFCSSQRTCEYMYGYGDGSSTSGDFSIETISLTTTTGSVVAVPNFAFGCGHNNEGTFSNTDGLVGLGLGPLSLPSQLGYLFGNVFSYCLVTLTDSASQTSPLLFGDAAVPKSTFLKYTPLISNNANPSFYYVQLQGVSVNGQLLSIPSSAFDIDSSGNGGTILDSGTTITQLVSQAYSPLLQKIESLLQYPTVDGSGIGLDLCYDMSGVSSPKLPSVTFHFLNMDVILPPNNIFITVDNQGTTCLAFGGEADLSIFGNVQQQNYQIVYDRRNSRVGFLARTCDQM